MCQRLSLAQTLTSYGSVDYLDKGFTGHIIRRGSADADASINWALGLMNEGSQIIDNTTNLNASFNKCIEISCCWHSDQK